MSVWKLCMHLVRCARVCVVACTHSFRSANKHNKFQCPSISAGIAMLCYAMYISHTYGIMNMHNVESGRGRGSSSTNIKYLSMCNFFFFCVMKYGIFALCCCLFFIDMLLRDGIILVGLEDPLRLAPTESCGGRGYGILCVMHRPHYNLVVAILLCVVCAQIFANQS